MQAILFVTSSRTAAVEVDGTAFEFEARVVDSDRLEYETSHQDQLDEDTDEFSSANRHKNFIDGPLQAAARLEELLTKHKHPLIQTWDSSADQWRFTSHNTTCILTSQDGTGMTVHVASDILPRRHLDPLRQKLRQMLAQAVEASQWSVWDMAIVLLQMCEEMCDCIKTFLNANKPGLGTWNAQTARGWGHGVADGYGVDLSSVNDTAQFLLGQSIKDICAGISEWLRIIHVEPVFRQSQALAFLQRQEEIRQDLLQQDYRALRKCVTKAQIRSREVIDDVPNIAEYLSRSRVTFHGTQTRLLDSIVRYGFIVPGGHLGETGETLEARCGSTYGRGIYSSPDPFFCLSYSDYLRGSEYVSDSRQIAGFRLIVCATLMGRSLETHRGQALGVDAVLKAGAHSHVSPDGKEFIVFDSAQIVPCYVLTLDLGAERAKRILQLAAEDPENWKTSVKQSRILRDTADEDYMMPGAVLARKQALKAAALKWFPYGYGSASGTNFVIEDIGDITDDEEDYGDFQAMRHAAEGQEARENAYSYDRPHQEKASWFDTYQTVRHTKAEVSVDDLED